jgi:hypothetical protein
MQTHSQYKYYCAFPPRLIECSQGATEIPIYEAQYPAPSPCFHYEYGGRWHLQWRQGNSITLGFYDNGFAPKKKRASIIKG